MSPRFEPSDIDEVRDRADIVEVISEHVRLRRAGRSYKGLCPFHQEKTPSFTVDRDKGLYYCHGCHEGGSVFTFIEKVENLTFPESVEALAKRFGVELRPVAGTQRAASPRARLIDLHEEAVAYYERTLAGSDAGSVRDYLDSRDLDAQTRQRYRIGFGGWRRDSLVRAMVRKGFTTEELQASGLVTRDGRGTRDTFFGRVLFPIFDPAGKPVAFGGRVLPEAHRRPEAPDGPKYLNSRETPVFRKSRILYGANWARGEAARSKRLVLVEGYTDVIAMHASGVGDAVATCGTSLTEQHMQEISRRFGDVRVIQCLDGDLAGQAAMQRAQGLTGDFTPGEQSGASWLPVGQGWLPQVYVATLPGGTDPADFARDHGREAVAGILDDAVPLVEFLLRRALSSVSTNRPEDRAQAVRMGATILGDVGDSLLRHEYALWLADRTGVDPYEVAKAVEEQARQVSAPRSRTAGPKRSAAPPEPTLSGAQRIEREALQAILAWPHLLEADLVTESSFSLPVHASLFRLLQAEASNAGTIDAGRLADRVQDEAMRRLVTELAVRESPAQDAGREMLVRVKEMEMARRIDECKLRLRGLDPQGEAEAYDALFEELLQLENTRRALTGRQ